MFLLTFFAFLITWLGATAYTLWAIVDQTLPYSSNIFWSLIIILDVLGFLLLWLWYERSAKTIQLRTGILLAFIILVFFWGFATLHSFLSLHLNSLQIRWLGFVYIWEVVIVGAMVSGATLRVTRFADRFLKGELSQKDSEEHVHVRIASIPLRASLIYTAMVIVGYAIGSLQLWYFAALPGTEVIKNMSSGLVVSMLSAVVLFFALERIIDPALRKSGTLLSTTEREKTKRFSLFTKIYVISGLLVLTSVGFFGNVSYGGGQLMLEEQLKRSLLDRMVLIRLAYQDEQGLPSQEVLADYLGEKGTVVVLARPHQQASVLFPEDLALSEESKQTAIAYAQKQASFIDRSGSTKVLTLMPIDPLHTLLSIVEVSDFSQELNLFVMYDLIVLFMILVALAMIGTLFAQSITLPIQEIKAGGVRIGQGDFSQYINVHTNDELEDLSDALNEATAKLKTSYHYLEDTVAQRTKELEAYNERQQQQIQELDNASKLLVKREFALQSANESLRSLDQAKTQFVSVAAHQLRTPLSVSKWTFQMLLSGDFGPLNKEQEEVLKRGNEMNEQMIDLVSDLLDVARIESGKLDYVFKAVDLGTFLPDIQNLFIQKSQERQVSFNLEIPPSGQQFIRADEVRLRMVFQNLIDNAFKFTPSGGKITVSFERKEDMYEFRVTDSGIGISQEELPRLFTKFFRARNAVVMDTRGTGLGLYIVSNIIRTHGGTISVSSQVGQGTTVLFSLPVAHSPESETNPIAKQ